MGIPFATAFTIRFTIGFTITLAIAFTISFTIAFTIAFTFGITITFAFAFAAVEFKPAKQTRGKKLKRRKNKPWKHIIKKKENKNANGRRQLLDDSRTTQCNVHDTDRLT